ncbi:MAG: glycosyltransferase family 4 protein [Acidimicrobiales bacterium]
MTLRVLLLLGQNLGWRTYAATLTTALERRDDVEVVVSVGGRAASGAGQGRATAPRHREATRLVRDVRLAGDLRANLRGGRPDVVHAAGHLMARPLLWPGVMGDDISLSVLLDGTARQSDRAKGVGAGVGRLAWRDERRVLRRADLVNCVSQWAADSVAGDYGVTGGRIRVRPYPIADIDTGLLEQASTRREGAGDRPVQLLCVAGDFERKGGPWLLRTFAERWAAVAELHVVSDTAPRDGLPPGVFVHHGVDNESVRTRFFPAADLLVHPTRFDQSSMVAIEAAAFALPAVVTDVGGVGEVVDHEHTGLVADTDTGVARAIDRLIADAALRRRLGEAARRRFLDLHEADRSVARLVADWHQLVDQSPG